MLIELAAVEITGDGGARVACSSGGIVQVGSYEVAVEVVEAEGRVAGVRWRVANRGDTPQVPRHVRLVFDLPGAVEPLRFFRHGYQSWSPTGVATFGVDHDPSTDERCFRFVRDAYLGDPARVHGDELRSELVTVVADPDGRNLLAGFEGASTHDGTLRLRRAPEGAGIELVAEAYLSGAVLAAGAERVLHDVVVVPGDDPAALLGAWAARVGQASGARTGAPFQVGWCSWYHYFHEVTEDAFRANLAVAAGWPFDVFQLDDGYQAEIGDWLGTNDKFPGGLEGIATAIGSAGHRPGLWLAPFLAAPASTVAIDHPDWLVQLADESGPLPSWFNPPWGGVMWGLDTTEPEVIAHLEAVAAQLVALGFTYLKLDFTMAPGLDGRFRDPALTPAERVRAGYDAVRRGAGDDAFLLGCGAPIGPCIGVVDGMRIGPDVAPSWHLDRAPLVPSLGSIEPATAHAYRNTLTRAFQHRRLWLNDPDCLMLRTSETALDPDAVRTWAHVVGVSGGMALVSDDLALLGDAERALLDEVVALGRASDDAARAGGGATSADLMQSDPPRRFAAAGYELETDPDTARSVLARR